MLLASLFILDSVYFSGTYLILRIDSKFTKFVQVSKVSNFCKIYLAIVD